MVTTAAVERDYDGPDVYRAVLVLVPKHQTETTILVIHRTMSLVWKSTSKVWISIKGDEVLFLK